MEEETEVVECMGGLSTRIAVVRDACEELLMLWCMRQPALCPPNKFARQANLQLHIDTAGHNLTIMQVPSSMGKPGVTGAVVWDSGIVLAKFLEHAVDSKMMNLRGTKCIELGAGCGLVGCVAALHGAQVVLTDLPDRLRLLNKNIEENINISNRHHTYVEELTWGEDLNGAKLDLPCDYVLASDVIYDETAVKDLLKVIKFLSCSESTIIISAELRNDVVLEYFLECALEEFSVGRLFQSSMHPDYQTPRVVIYILTTKRIPN